MKYQLLLSLMVSLIPATCLALLYSVEGNQKQSPANYADWPKLVEVVNDPSRARLVWCNGNEYLYYRGDTKTLNRVLKKFADVESDELRLVIRPAYKSTNEKERPFDCKLHVVGGIAKAVIGREGPTPVEDNVPTMTVFLTEQIDLAKIEIPPGVVVEQIADLEARYKHALAEGNPSAKESAKRALENLKTDADRKGADAKAYKESLRKIVDWISERDAKKD